MKDNSRYKIVRFNPLPFNPLWRGRGLWPLPLLSMYCIPLQIIMWLWFNTSHQKPHIFICFLEEKYFRGFLQNTLADFQRSIFWRYLENTTLFECPANHETWLILYAAIRFEARVSYLLGMPCIYMQSTDRQDAH